MLVSFRVLALTLTLLTLGTFVTFLGADSTPAAEPAPDAKPMAASDSGEGESAGAKVEPVEADMHELMEYAFEEPYKRLKAALATPPADRAAWKVIKSDALLLAEGGNLLLSRGPEKHRDAWERHSVEVRTVGAALYKAAKTRDHAAARPEWEALVQKCNACHNAFADGEHQLTP